MSTNNNKTKWLIVLTSVGDLAFSRKWLPRLDRANHHANGGPHSPTVAYWPCWVAWVLGSGHTVGTTGCPWCFPLPVMTLFSVVHPKGCHSLCLFNLCTRQLYPDRCLFRYFLPSIYGGTRDTIMRVKI